MANSQIWALDVVFTLDQHPRPLFESPAGIAVLEDVEKAVPAENISKPESRIACRPAVALGDISLRADAGEVVGAIGLPDAEQVLASIDKG